MEEEFADAAEEANDVGTAESMTFLITDGFEELVDPDGGVDGEAFSSEGFEFDRACTGLDDGPEACDTHCGVELLVGGCWERVREDCSWWEGGGGGGARDRVWENGRGGGEGEGGGWWWWRWWRRKLLTENRGKSRCAWGCACNVAVEHKQCVSESQHLSRGGNLGISEEERKKGTRSKRCVSLLSSRYGGKVSRSEDGMSPQPTHTNITGQLMPTRIDR